MQKWQDYEKQFLSEVYGLMPVSEISDKLERTENAVRHKANKMGLRSKIPFSSNTKHSIAELKELIEFGYEPKQIANILKVSVKGVYNTVRDRSDLGGVWYKQLLNNRKHNRRRGLK